MTIGKSAPGPEKLILVPMGEDDVITQPTKVDTAEPEAPTDSADPIVTDPYQEGDLPQEVHGEIVDTAKYTRALVVSLLTDMCLYAQGALPEDDRAAIPFERFADAAINTQPSAVHELKTGDYEVVGDMSAGAPVYALRTGDFEIVEDSRAVPVERFNEPSEVITCIAEALRAVQRVNGGEGIPYAPLHDVTTSILPETIVKDRVTSLVANLITTTKTGFVVPEGSKHDPAKLVSQLGLSEDVDELAEKFKRLLAVGE